MIFAFHCAGILCDVRWKFDFTSKVLYNLNAYSISAWRDGRAVEGTGLENRRRATYRGFESHSLRSCGEVPKRLKGTVC